MSNVKVEKQEPVAWKNAHAPNGLLRFMTQKQYDANPKLQKYYEPFSCAECEKLKADFARSEDAWQMLDNDRVQYLNDVGDVLGQNNTDESLLNAAKRVMATVEFQKKAVEAYFVRMARMEVAVERMRIAGGKDEFQKAFDDAKGLL